jgi:hypothetical protein
MRISAASIVIALLAGGSTLMAAEPKKPGRAIRRSDVVFMYDDPKLYEAYGCTALGWAGRSRADHIRRAHAAGVRHFSCSVGFLTEFRRVIDFDPNFLDAACRNFAGQPFVVPWLWDHKYEGRPAYWWCTNSPLYRSYLHKRLEETMAAGCDGLHVDDYRGTSGCVTWLAGCFCRHCMAAFREYLARNVAKEKLAALGVGDLATFDYRQFLLARGVTPEDYPKRRSRLPLAEEFRDFQVKANNAFVASYHKRACELAGRSVGLSVNSGLGDPHGLVIAPHLSSFCCEVWHAADKRRPPVHPVYIYKLGEGLDRPVCSTAAGQDWAFISQHKLPGLVRTWIALSYAFGHNFMAPHRQWCYTKEKGTHWYAGATEEYAWVYRFVRSQARLLDGYEAVSPVAVIYSNAANRRGRGRIEAICADLAQANVPFGVLVAGDDWLPDYRLRAADLAQARAVIVPKQLDLDEAQQKLLDRAAAGRLVTWPDRQKLAHLVPAPVTVEGAERVWAVPRAIPGERTRPVVVHLLNRSYDASSDAVVPQKDLRLRLRRDLFGGRKLTKAVAHAPKALPVVLDTAGDREYVTFTVPRLALWAIVELGG